MDILNVNLDEISSSGKSGKAHFTSAERDLARQCAAVVLVATKKSTQVAMADHLPEADSVVVKLLPQAITKWRASKGESTIANLMRTLYGECEVALVKSGAPTSDFPSTTKAGKRAQREWSSLTVLFRGAFTGGRDGGAHITGFEEATEGDQAWFKAYSSAYGKKEIG